MKSLTIWILSIFLFSSITWATPPTQITKQDVNKILQLYKQLNHKSDKCQQGCHSLLNPDQIITLHEQQQIDIETLMADGTDILIIQPTGKAHKINIKFSYSYRGSCAKAVWGNNPYSRKFGYMGCMYYNRITEKEEVEIEFPQNTEHDPMPYLVHITGDKTGHKIEVKTLEGNKLKLDVSSGFLGMFREKIKVLPLKAD